jgi:hypothetical protein
MYDPNLNATVYDRSVDYIGPKRQAANQMPIARRSGVGQGVNQGQWAEAIMRLLASSGGGQQRDPIAQYANAWGNAQGITPENQWDSRWGLQNDPSLLGQWSRRTMDRQEPTVNLDARPAKQETWESYPAGGGGIVYSPSQVPAWERGAVSDVHPWYDILMRSATDNARGQMQYEPGQW